MPAAIQAIYYAYRAKYTFVRTKLYTPFVVYTICMYYTYNVVKPFLCMHCSQKAICTICMYEAILTYIICKYVYIIYNTQKPYTLFESMFYTYKDNMHYLYVCIIHR